MDRLASSRRPDLAGWIAQLAPDMVLAGHVRGPPFTPDGSWVDRIGTTWVFDPGNQRGPVPTFVDIDLDTNEATWVSQMCIEHADLTDLTAATAVAGALF